MSWGEYRVIRTRGPQIFSERDCSHINHGIEHFLKLRMHYIVRVWGVQTWSKPSIIRLQLIRVSDNEHRNMKNEKFCSQLGTYTWDLGVRGLQTVLRAAGETETAQGNIQDWLQLDEGDPGFQLTAYIDWLRAERARGRCSSPGRIYSFPFSTSSTPVLGPTQPPVQWYLGMFPRG
jgi:hypothetical protein